MTNQHLIDLPLGALLANTAKRFPDHLAVKYTERDYERSYSEFNAECDAVAKGLYAMGIRKGDHVAIWATNVPEWLVAVFATAKIGAVLVTVNTNYKIFELEYLLRQSDSKALILIDGFKDANYLEIFDTLCPSCKTSQPGELSHPMLPMLKHVVYVGEDTPPGMYNWRDIEDMGKDVSDDTMRGVAFSISCHDVINIQYTSGTTGFPKGVMLSHYNIVNNGLCIGDRMKFTEDDKLCIPVPFFHCFGLVLAIMACVTHGTSMVPLVAYHPLRVMEAVQNEQCTALHGVPTMFIGVLEHPEFRNFTFPRLRTGIMAGSPCPIKVMQQVVDDMGMRDITIVYGLTEASPGCTQTTTDDTIERRVSTVGRVFPGVEAKVVDPETGEELPPNTPGEFCARGYNIMKGYYKMPEATAQVIDTDGWLHSGDLASVDEEGYFKITGRIKDMIIRGGENIYPKEIEEFLYTYEPIRDVQVIGVPSKQYGEEICACVILKESASVTEDEIKEHVRSHMARHKTPKYIWVMDAFPTTASGKIQKYKLREGAIDLFHLGEEAAIETA